MNRGSTFYSVFLMMIASIVFTLGNYQDSNATTSAPDLIDEIYNGNSNNITQSSSEDNIRAQDSTRECKQCNDNDNDKSINNDNDKSINNDNDKSINNDNDNDKFGDSVLTLPFNSHITDQSTNVKEYVRDMIPFP